MENHWLPKYHAVIQDALLALENGDLMEARLAGRAAASYFEKAVNWQEARKLEGRVVSIGDESS